MKFLLFLQSLLIFLLILSSWSFINLLRSKSKFISFSFVRISYICVLLTFIHHIRLYLIIFNRSGDIEKILDPSLIFIKVLLFVTGIMISIRMLKICDESICKPLSIIFRSCLENRKFPSEWKKANVVPAFKKNNKQELKNYRLISLLPASSKIFERLGYDTIFKFFTENNLISLNQSGFKPGDSCVNQFLSISHQIFKSLDNSHEVRSVFLDMSKDLDKVWHKGLIFKLKQNGISGNLLSTLTDFLKLRKHGVVLNGQLSSWSNTELGVPQGSILGPLLFLIYINDLSEGLTKNAKRFADDVSLFSVVDNINLSATNLNSDLGKINAWANQWKMTFNPDPNKQAQEVIFSRKIRKTSHPPLTYNNNSVKQVQFQKHLGVYLDSRLDFREHFK